VTVLLYANRRYAILRAELPRAGVDQPDTPRGPSPTWIPAID
jgi:hypothetical protein